MSHNSSSKATWTIKQIASFLLAAFVVVAFWANIPPLVNFFWHLLPIVLVIAVPVVIVKIARNRAGSVAASAARATKKK